MSGDGVRSRRRGTTAALPPAGGGGRGLRNDDSRGGWPEYLLCWREERERECVCVLLTGVWGGRRCRKFVGRLACVQSRARAKARSRGCEERRFRPLGALDDPRHPVYYKSDRPAKREVAVGCELEGRVFIGRDQVSAAGRENVMAETTSGG
ncbi:hypothetical protein LX32DRAFT_269143 [Colletotrichum zoysiae]|uniref:Uncharacterized protein n=1 Tax=Colletotrichum zoysiae TaxID=1216348 RepID=A0AAD9M3D0_9PEZI|nr:hypothetical protein LX32DRAFT_269143 [Colletotrichum zoysiae]